MGDCFIIMPITTPDAYLEKYDNDKDHFKHVLESLFIPAIKAVGLNPVPPKSSGSEIIQADIINNLSSAELVLCDMSILNPNVFFELGIRTALDKPVALVIDEQTAKPPFDLHMINNCPYKSSLKIYETPEDLKNLIEHLKKTLEGDSKHNSLWKYFGITSKGTYRPEDATMENKVDFLVSKIESIDQRIDSLDHSTAGILSNTSPNTLHGFYTAKSTEPIPYGQGLLAGQRRGFGLIEEQAPTGLRQGGLRRD